jgi:high affinity Mn2+ porin
MERRARWWRAVSMLAFFPSVARAEGGGDADKTERRFFSLHFQQTTVTQGHPPFDAPYSGVNSMQADSETATSITSTLYGGLALWPGAEIYLNPELSGGGGISSAHGMAGFVNGEAFRIGDPTPVISLARLFLRQTIDLGETTERVEDGPNTIAGKRSPERLTITAGKLGIADIFDNNRYTHDPRSQFLNWALMNSGAWDYPADTRGYTWGLSLEYARRDWTLRVAATLVPKDANGLTMDTNVDKALGFALENEIHYAALGAPGTIRVLVFLNDARMGDYNQAIAENPTAPDVTATRQYGRTKYGFALNVEQELAEGVGAFARLSWNDGKHETWAFAEIDQSLAAGISWNGETWSRPKDEVGAAIVLDGLSGPHRRYLAAGGNGFMIGDGRLSYGLETIGELYYKLALTEAVAFSGDYQLGIDPGYNRDRGPVHVFGVRSHIEF